jgi:hypothetical protein
VLSRSGGRFAIPTSSVALTLAGSISVAGAAKRPSAPSSGTCCRWRCPTRTSPTRRRAARA